MKRVKVTVLGATNQHGQSEYTTTVQVDDKWKPPPITNADDWIEIEGSDGSYVIVPPQRVIGIFVEAGPQKAAKGGRIN